VQPRHIVLRIVENKLYGEPVNSAVFVNQSINQSID